MKNDENTEIYKIGKLSDPVKKIVQEILLFLKFHK